VAHHSSTTLICQHPFFSSLHSAQNCSQLSSYNSLTNSFSHSIQRFVAISHSEPHSGHFQWPLLSMMFNLRTTANHNRIVAVYALYFASWVLAVEVVIKPILDAGGRNVIAPRTTPCVLSLVFHPMLYAHYSSGGLGSGIQWVTMQE